LEGAVLRAEPIGGAGPMDPSAPEASEPLYGRNFKLVFAANFALNLAVSLFVMLPAFVMHLGGGAAQIGAVIAAGGVAALAVRPLNGVGVDRLGHRWVAMRFLILDAVATALYIPVASLGWPLFTVRVIHGAIDGTARVALFAMVYELLPAGQRRGEAMATFTLCSMIPAALGPAMGEEIIAYFGFGWFFGAAAMLCLVSAAIASRLPASRAVTHRAATTAPASAAGFMDLLRDRVLLPLWMVTLLWAIALASRTFVIPFAYQQGIARVGWYFMLYAGVAVVLRIFAAGVLDRVGLDRILAPALAVTAIGLGLLALYRPLRNAGLSRGGRRRRARLLLSGAVRASDWAYTARADGPFVGDFQLAAGLRRNGGTVRIGPDGECDRLCADVPGFGPDRVGQRGLLWVWHRVA
jgi:MFS family permease